MNRSEYFALRVNHFLKGYRKKKGLTQTQLATEIKVTKSTVSRIENGQDKQIAEVLAMLERIAELEGMDVRAFLAYLEGKPDVENQTTLYPWQSTVLNALGHIKQSVRLDLVAEVMTKKPAEIEHLLLLLVRIQRLPKASQQSIEFLIDNLKS